MEDLSSIYQLIKGRTYKVTIEFIDYDRMIHKVGETWIFEKTTFLPYHSGLTLFVIENGENVAYRFQSEPDEQQELLNTFMDYVELVEL